MARRQVPAISWLTLGALVVGLASPAAAFDLAEWARLVDNPTLGDPVTLAGPLKLGRGEIVPQPGARARVLLCGETPCGLAIAGPAGFHYRVEDRFSVPVAQRNLKRATSLEVTVEGGVLTVGQNLDSAVVWGFDLPELAGLGPGRGTEALPEWATKVLDRPLFSHPSLDLAVARFLGDKGVVYALLDGAKEKLLLNVDPGDERVEQLFRLDRITGNDRVYGRRCRLETLAAQPIGRQWWDRRPAALVAEHETIQVDNPEGEEVKVTTTSHLRATRAGGGLWRVDLWDDVVRNDRELQVEVTAVTVRGVAAPFLHQDEQLLVRVDPPLASNETVEVTVSNHGPLAIRPQGDSYWALGAGPWYPQPDLNGELATLELQVRVPAPFVVFASGETTSRTTENGFNVLKTRSDKPMQFPVVIAGKYKVEEETRDGVRCTVAAYALDKREACLRLMNNFFESAKFYQSVLGMPYPFKEMEIVEINDWGFGQAPPGVIFITQEAYSPLSGTINQIFSGGVNERVVHEIAHAWWGHVVKMDSAEEQWLTESFAEYSAALCLQAAKGGGKKGDAELRELIRGWKAGASLVGDGGCIYLANYLARHNEEDHLDRVRLLYNKGPLVLHALRLELRAKYGQEKGEQLFFTLLRSFLKSFTYKWGATRHVVGILNQITGDDWQPWFERYVYGCETPKVE